MGAKPRRQLLDWLIQPEPEFEWSLKPFTCIKAEQFIKSRRDLGSLGNGKQDAESTMVKPWHLAVGSAMWVAMETIFFRKI